MATCRKCKKELAEEWVACPFCGAKVTKPKQGVKSRGNGTGTAIKRGKTWTAKVVIRYRTVKRDGLPDKILPVTRSKGGFKTKTEALSACAALKAEKKERKAPTLASYYETYSAGNGSKLSDSKQTAYQIAYNRLEKIHNMPINTILFADIQQIINENCKTYYPARDVKNLLSHLYKLAAVDGFVDASLPHLLSLPSNTETKREAFTSDEQKKLWTSYERGNKNAALPLIMIYTGMMTGEMRQLSVSMINIEEQKIYGVGLKTKERKTKPVLVPAAIIPLLQDLMNGKDGLLYPMNETDFYELYYSALTEAGITRKLTPYSCRHTTATMLTIDKSIAPQVVQRILRWSSTKMMDRYVHPDDTSVLEMLNKIGSTEETEKDTSKQ